MVRAFKERVPEEEELMEEDSLTKKYIGIAARNSLKNNNKNNSSYYRVAKDTKNFAPEKTYRILDLAGGYGALSKSLTTIYPNAEITCLDASAWTLNLGKKINKSKKIRFLLGNAEKLPFSKGHFDLVVCRDAIHQFRKPKIVLREANRVLRAGGTLYLIDLNRGVREGYITDGLFEFVYSNPRLSAQYLSSLRAAYTMKEVRELLRELKLKKYSIKSLENFKKDKYFRTRWRAIILK